jgi:hypothetical protein
MRHAHCNRLAVFGDFEAMPHPMQAFQRHQSRISRNRNHLAGRPGSRVEQNHNNMIAGENTP